MPRWARLLVLLVGVVLGTVPVSLFALGVSTGDGAWSWQNPLPQGNDLHNVRFADASTGWAIGKGGLILHTSDVGGSWSTQNSRTTEALLGIAILDASDAVIVGTNGAILQTADAGTTWTHPTSGTAATLVSVQFVDAANIFASGTAGTLLKSSNSGGTWQSLASPDTADLRAMEFLDPLTGWVLADGSHLYATIDGGTTWKLLGLPAGADVRAFQVLPDRQTAMAVGASGLIYKSTDGGLTWRAVQSPTAATLSAVGFSDPQTTHAVGDGGVILKSTDAGESWALHVDPSLPAVSLIALNFVDNATGYIAGFNGTLLRTSDAGATWTPTGSGPRAGLAAIAFISQEVGVAVGDQGAIFKTADSGNTWRQIQSGTARNLNAIQFINHQTAFAVGDGGTILRSDDTGESWHPVASPVGVNLRGIAIVNASSAGLLGVGVIVGDTDVVLRSPDQGTTWTQASVSGARDQLYSVSFPDPRVGYIGGAASILQTTDYGLSWRIVSRSPPRDPLSFSFPTVNRGFAVGRNGQIFRTDDGGTTWTAQQSRTTQALHQVQFLSEGTGYAVGDTGTILVTNNGGQTWTQVVSGTHLNLRGLVFRDRGFGVAVGDGGAVLKTLSGGLPTQGVPPAVMLVVPAPDATDIVDTTVRISFNKDIVFSPADYGEGRNFQLRDQQGKLVGANATYDAANRQLVIRPTDALADGARYSLTVRAGNNGTLDVEGRPMVFDFASTFRTACALTAAGGFSQLIQQDAGIRAAIGCPTATEQNVDAVEQVFERGHILRVANAKQVLVTYFDTGQWTAVDATFTAGSSEPNLRAPDGLLAPTGPFGKIWREQSGVRDRLGWAVGPERAFQGATQTFSGGNMLWTGTDQWLIRVYFNNGTTNIIPDPNTPALSSSNAGGFVSQPSFTGDCKYTPQGSACVRFEDGYIWLVYDGVNRQQPFGTFQGNRIIEALGQRAAYYHVLGTDLVRTVPR